MGYYEFPHTRNYDTDLGYLIKRYFELSTDFESLEKNFNDLKAWCIAQLNSEALKTLVANKLDEWLQDGTLASLINNALLHVTTYDTVVEMLTHTGLENGSKIYCTGADSVNDGKGGHFRIRARLSTDTIDNYTLYLIDGGIKVAERIIEKFEYVTPEMFGAIGDGINDDTQAIISAINSEYDVKFTDNKIYGIQNADTLFSIHNKKLFADNSATIKFLKDGSSTGLSSPSFHSLVNIKGNDFELKNLIFDCNNDWVQRPLKESGEEWTNYLNKRNSTICCTIISDASNFKLENCIFTKGVASVKVQNSHNFIINNCEFNYTLADSLYVTDSSYKGTITNCYAHHNGDDTYCANVDSGGIEPPHQIEFINCSGDNLYGSLCEVFGGNDIKFLNCTGSCLRASGLRIERVDTATYYEKNCENVTFENCNINCASGGTIAQDYNTNKKQINAIIKNSTINGGDIQFVNVSGVILDNVILNNCTLYIIRSKYTKIINSVLNLEHNLNIENSANITISNSTIHNLCTKDDRIHANIGTTENNRRRCINVMYGSLIAINNVYQWSDNSVPNFTIAIDGYANVDYLKTDTNKLLMENNEVDNILSLIPLMSSENSIYNWTSALGNGSIYYDGTHTYMKTGNGLIQLS